MSVADDTTRFLELADRFDQLAATEHDGAFRREYGRIATQLRQLASERILDPKR